MAASAKKKSKKGKTLSLNEFLVDDKGGNAPPSYPNPKPTSWADETDDLDGDVSTSWHTVEDTYRAPPIDRSILPTAPRAAREPNVDRSRLPRNPPYTAFLGNLPYDVSEESIKEFFRGLAISAVRLPREPSNPERLKGFGYAEFDDVDSLLRALTLNEENLGNRRIRVDIADQSNDKERDSGSMMGRDRDRDRSRMIEGGPDKTDSDWRARPSGDDDDGPRRDEGFGDKSRDRYESDRFRDGPRRDDRYDSGRDRFGGRDRYDDRGSRDYDRGGFDSRGGGRRGFSSGFRQDYGERRDGDRYGDQDRLSRRDDRGEERAPLQRPKLNLKPRSVPKEEEQSGSPSPQSSTVNSSRAASIFGAAKPVDTAAREREMEERLKKEQERLQRQLEEDKNRGLERKPRDREPSWRSEEPKERERTGNESSHPKGSRSSRDGEHSENEILSGQEDEPISPASPSPSSNQGGLPLKVMPAPPPKENVWAKRSAGGSASEVPPPVSPSSQSAPKLNRSTEERVSGKVDENRVDGVRREKSVPEGRGGVGRGGGRGRGIDAPNMEKRREPADRKEVRREREPRIASEPKKFEETAPPKFSSASKYAALLMDGDQGEDDDGEE
ncbi:eukaryotic translation initiation factor 4Bb isoform X1 [Misgurnus anguillicaudatus]|uniref:eukaryotic translation initiation factor 4Bb isoform X1 n=1 Tax=Misgurnus anguillicaudatus TaxID=75329 RepID=UPI002435B204|nr:eukaryotic translation initiation factor 4Bb isoform X1 [Misgurnus anguillicaudatus]